jgi:hypothetical protein
MNARVARRVKGRPGRRLLLCMTGFFAGSYGLGTFGLVTMVIGALPLFFYTRKKKRYREDLVTSNKYSSGMLI